MVPKIRQSRLYQAWKAFAAERYAELKWYAEIVEFLITPIVKEGHSVTANIDLSALLGKPRVLGNGSHKCETSRCMMPDTSWNPILKVWQCGGCRGSWAAAESQKIKNNLLDKDYPSE